MNAVSLLGRNASTAHASIKKRKTGYLVILVYVVVAIWMIACGFFEEKKDYYYPDKDLCNRITKNQTSTETCFNRAREGKKSFSMIISLGFGVLGVLLAPFVRCFCEFIEQLFYLKSRNRRSIWRLFISGFGNVQWAIICVFVTLDVIFCIVLRYYEPAEKTFTTGDLMYILGGIGIPPLVVVLLKLDTKSKHDLEISRKRRIVNPGFTIAWYYYSNNLKEAVSIFNKCFTRRDTPAHDNTDNIPRLSLKKIILLFPSNGKTKPMSKVDNTLKNSTSVSKDGYKFPVYKFKFSKKEYKCVIKYPEQPFKTLRTMTTPEGIRCLDKNDLKDQICLLYETVENEILSTDEECRGSCLLVKMEGNMERGWLARLIIHQILNVELQITPTPAEVEDSQSGSDSGSDLDSDLGSDLGFDSGHETSDR